MVDRQGNEISEDNLTLMPAEAQPVGGPEVVITTVIAMEDAAPPHVAE